MVTTPSSTVSKAESTENVAEIVSNVPYDKKEVSTVSAPTVSESENSTSSAPTAPFFVLPVGGIVTKEYDEKTPQYSETYKDWRLHLGIDITAETGTAVYSSASGEVTKIYDDAMWGKVVEISHGGGIVGIYCGLNKNVPVNEGDQIEPGQQIGSIYSVPCEAVEPAHIHFAMKLDGKWVNPTDYMN